MLQVSWGWGWGYSFCKCLPGCIWQGPEKYTSTAYMNTPQADNRWCKAPALSLQKEVLQALLNDLKKVIQTAGVEIKKDKK